MMPMLPLVADSFAVSAAQSGHIISAYAAGVVVGAPLLMMLTPKLDRRIALILFAMMILSSMASVRPLLHLSKLCCFAS
ncbi:MAG: hypothetical protein LRY40_02305 [Shewanella fodinae]|nr:hypothetical protein [Shewanella fodinae]